MLAFHECVTGILNVKEKVVVGETAQFVGIGSELNQESLVSSSRVSVEDKQMLSFGGANRIGTTKTSAWTTIAAGTSVVAI